MASAKDMELRSSLFLRVIKKSVKLCLSNIGDIPQKDSSGSLSQDSDISSALYMTIIMSNYLRSGYIYRYCMRSFVSYPVKRILVPVDFSEESRQAFLYAMDLSREFGARITLFHAAHLLEVDSPFVQMATEAQIEKSIELRLSEWGRHVISHSASGLEFPEIRVKYGTATDSIVAEAASHSYDLIIMGTQGAHGIEDGILGTVSSHVIRRTDIPVMVIPVGRSFKPINSILYATNFAENDLQSIYLVTRYFKIFRPSITILHVQQQGALLLDRQRMDEFVGQVKKNIPYATMNFLSQEGESVGEVIQEIATSGEYDLLCLSIRRLNPFDRVTTRSETKKVVKDPRLPVLVLHAQVHSSTPVF